MPQGTWADITSRGAEVASREKIALGAEEATNESIYLAQYVFDPFRTLVALQGEAGRQGWTPQILSSYLPKALFFSLSSQYFN